MLIGLTLLLACGCASKLPVRGVNLVIGPECKATATLLNCTHLDHNPPTCEKAQVLYPRGCEKVAVK